MNLEQYKQHILNLLQKNNKMYLDKLHKEGYKLFQQPEFAGDEHMIGGSYPDEFPTMSLHEAPSYGVEGFSSGKGGSFGSDLKKLGRKVAKEGKHATKVVAKQAKAKALKLGKEKAKELLEHGLQQLEGSGLKSDLAKVKKSMLKHASDAHVMAQKQALATSAVVQKQAPKALNKVKKTGESVLATVKKQTPKLLKKAKQAGDDAVDYLGSGMTPKHQFDFVKSVREVQPTGGKFKMPKIKVPKSVTKTFKSIGNKIGAEVINHGTDMALDALASGGSLKKKRTPSKRNMLISKLMREHGMSLGEASKHIKENGLV